MYKPSIHENHIHRQRILDKLDQGLQLPLTLVAAPAGYGKSTSVGCWLDTSSSPSAWVSLDKNDNDLRLFLNYFVAAVQSMFPDAVPEMKAMVNSLTLPPLSVLAVNIINEIDRIEQHFILVLDDFHLIEDESVLDLITQLLHHPPRTMHLVLISRQDPLLPISTLRAKHLVTEIRTQDLRFNQAETAAFLTKVLGNQVASATVAAMDKKTEGWVTGLHLSALAMLHRGKIASELLEPQTDAHYVMEYLSAETLAHQPPEIKQFLMSTAILDRFCGSLCETLCMQSSEPLTNEISGRDFINWLNQENLFLIPLDAENRWFRYHHLFQNLLINQLKSRESAEKINELHTRASAWFAENGLIEEAIRHALAGENFAAAARLVAQNGFELVSEERWPTLNRWLNLLPDDIIYQNLDLAILVAWTHMPFYRIAEMVTCLNKIAALFPGQATVEQQGHIDALRSYQHFVAADGERALSYAQRAYENIPRNHLWPRISVSIIQFLAHQVLGESEKVQSKIEEMMRDETLRGTSEGFLLASPCFIYWMAGDLTATLQTAAHAQKIAHLEAPFALGHGLYFSGIAYYDRNEFHNAEEKLLPLVKAPYLHHALNFAHSTFALALVYQSMGRTNKAYELAESVISYAHDTDNTNVLQIARAFQAELALLHGRLAEASRWAEQYVAEPLRPMYRFYVPQLTLVKVLLAQDTPDSRENATDLLTQLYDFVVSTYNTRFQIDVLALKALLYDSRKDEPAALKALTESLTLAEPGCFIRSFVDLGPRMADLLKALHHQGIAPDYIGKILAAFGQGDEPGVEPKTADRSMAAANHPLRKSTSIPPLVEPLTNRELDVLELLARRLSNQEIADKLYISTTTVKSHLKNIYGKLSVNKRREAVAKAMKIGILSGSV
ncbi:MAG: winged helix-turn-helix transcriptional regulator [Deltaproteobacteria bacterium]|nr:winged helix-turn-helix transcriptional regulator [Deltaproteobacteria bacterium]